MASWISDNDIERLEKVRDILKEIKELDNGFSLSNVIELNKEDVLVFNGQFCINKKQIEYAQQDLEDRFGCKCIVLASGLELNKVITKENKKIDYVTDTTYADGEVVKEITTYYK